MWTYLYAPQQLFFLNRMNSRTSSLYEELILLYFKNGFFFNQCYKIKTLKFFQFRVAKNYTFLPVYRRKAFERLFSYINIEALMVNEYHSISFLIYSLCNTVKSVSNVSETNSDTDSEYIHNFDHLNVKFYSLKVIIKLQ